MPNAYPTEQACQEARKRLERQGLSVKQWAEQHGLTASTVYAVLNGQKKCLRGESHRAAVLLGIKEGVIPQDHTVADQGCCPAPRTERGSDDA